MGVAKRKFCINAGQDRAHLKRPAPWPGPRCDTCHRIKKKESTAGSHDLYVQKTYGLLPGEYAILLAHQNGKCFICPRPLTSTSRRYAVDHDHKAEKLYGTRQSIRGLLCKRHNNLLRDVRDSVETLQKAIDYLTAPPAWDIIPREGNRE
jgi:hypothetical protein